MRDRAIEKVWEALNEDDDLDEKFKANFSSDCKEYGLLVAVYNLGFMMGGS